MNLELYIAFVAATTVLILIPGPAVSLILATSIGHGSRAALITVAGSSSAIAVLLAVTALGMTSLMVLLSEWFEWLRWAGVAYLVYLGLQHWLAVLGSGVDRGTMMTGFSQSQEFLLATGTAP